MTDKPLREPWPSVVGWPYSCDKCGEKGECFTGCGLAECDAVAIRESRPTPPQDAEAVAQARATLARRIEWVERGLLNHLETHAALDALIAAVRAECAAKVPPTPDINAVVARQRLDRIYEATAEGEYNVSAYCDARDALLAAVSRDAP